jgi:hypothetical protein
MAASLVITAAISPHAWAGDWLIAEDAARALLDGHLNVYAVMPQAQMGPLALVLAMLPRGFYMMTVCAVLPVAIHLATRDLRLSFRRTVALAVGATALVAPGWSWFAVTGHADDALVVLGAAGMLAGARRPRHILLVAGFLVAISAKPTAIVLAPLLLLGGWRAVGFGCALTAAVWLPFLLADPAGFVSAGGGIAPVWPGSLPELLGAEPWSEFPRWVRPVQLAGGWTVIWLVTRKHGAPVAIAAALAFRALLEPGTNYSYSTPAIFFGLVGDGRGGCGGVCSRPWPSPRLWSPTHIRSPIRRACFEGRSSPRWC